MSATSQAVFLSYASQDAEAAQRICDALRAAGVEVWFDRNELVGGDAWDQKIRRQIKECALLIPVISANTQARAEGYFRLEWRLADQRTHLMGRSKAFLLPVTIDGTKDSEADVPDSFLAVQWTKAPGGEVPPALVARVRQLLEGRPGSSRGPVGDTAAQIPTPSASPRGGRWILPAGVGLVVLAAASYLAIRPAAPTPPRPLGPAAPAMDAGRAELARLRERIVPDRWQREDFLAIRPELDRLLQQHPDLAEGWALRSIIHSLQVARSFDYGTQPLLAGKEDADRALRLAPGSALGELALGLHYTAMLIRGGDTATARMHVERALKVLPRDALTRYADIVSNWLGFRFDETEQGAKRWLEEEPGNAFPCWVLAQSNIVRRRLPEARQWSEATIAKGSGVTWVRGFYTLSEAEYFLAGDLPAARRALERVPAEFRTNQRIVYGRWLFACAEDNPDLALQELNRLPDTILADRNFHGPKALLAALAHRQAGRPEAAAIQFAEAEKLLRQMLAEDQDNEVLHATLAFTLAASNRPQAARAELTLIEPLIAGRPAGVYLGHLHAWLAQTYLELNDVPAFLPWFRRLVAGPSVNPFTAASLRYDPRFRKALELPEVKALLAEAGDAKEQGTTPAILSTPELAEIGRVLGGRTSIGVVRTELTSEKYRLLDELARKAIAATPGNAEAWAVAAEIDQLHLAKGVDQSRERLAQMKQRMLRAVALDAQSFDVRFVQAWVLSANAQTPAAQQEVMNQFLALQRERPDDEGTAGAIAWSKSVLGRKAEAAADLMKLRQFEPAFWLYLEAGDWTGAEEAARRKMDTPDGLSEGIYLLSFVQVNMREDLETGLATLERLPLAARLEERFALQLYRLQMLDRDADQAMRTLAGLPQEWAGGAPVAMLRGFVHHLAGRIEAAKIEWRQALALVEQRLQATPNSGELLRLRASLLAHLGDTSEALRLVESERQLSARAADDLGWSWGVHLLAGHKEAVLRWLEGELPKRQAYGLRSMARYSEHFDSLRGDPRFEKLLRDTRPPGAKPFDEAKPRGRQ